MPIPPVLVFLAVRGALAGASAVADIIERNRDQRSARTKSTNPRPPAGTFASEPVPDTLRLSILGQSKVGKTTLINAWLGRGVGHPTTNTNVTETHVDVAVTVGDRRLLITKLFDVSGREVAWSEWDRVTGQSSHILYLINALTLHQEESRPSGRAPTKNWDRIFDDAGQIRWWLEEHAAEVCILVVTHRDLDPRLDELGWDGYHQHIADQLEPVIFKLGGYDKVRVVTGSLDTEEAAAALTAKILAYLP